MVQGVRRATMRRRLATACSALCAVTGYGGWRRVAAGRSWLVGIGAVLAALVLAHGPRGWAFCLAEGAVALALLAAAQFGLRLAHYRSAFAAPWFAGVVLPLLALLMPAAVAVTGAWIVYPLAVITNVMYFTHRFARGFTLALTALLLGYDWWATGEPGFWRGVALAIFLLVLDYLITQTQQRESQLMLELAAHADEAEAIAAVSWSLSSLTPTAHDFTAIIKRACPPEVSLALLRYAENGTDLVCAAAAGDEQASMLRWTYQIGPASASMVAVALRERRTVTASLAESTAEYLLAGALPVTRYPLRSAVVIPIQRQGAPPEGVLLALSAHSGALGDPHRLGMLPAVASQIATALENARLFAEAQSRADHDAMTGLYHHRALHLRLGEEATRASRSGAPLALLMIDLDRFKLFNETYGHQVGDRIVLHVAALLARLMRPTDVLGRYGGDDFLAILPETPPAEARALADALVAAVAAETFRPREDAETMPLTISVGLAVAPGDGTSAQDLLATVETLMHEAKHNGGNRCEGVRCGDVTALNAGHVLDLRSFSALDALVTAVDHKDRYTREHSEEVAAYAQLLARTIGLPADRVALLLDAGLLHDVGKVGVPDAVLRKPGRLTADEFDAMKQHVVLSDALLRCLLPPETDPDVFAAVRNHHERWDGRGYPRGLAGEDVPLIGRIMIVADAVSAMHMDRPYRKGLAPEQIIDELRRNAGKQFDPALVEPFIAAFLDYHGLREDAFETVPASVRPLSLRPARLAPPDTTAA